MRLAALTLIGSLAVAAAVPASAAPAVAKITAPTVSNVIAVSGGCGPAFHRDYWGYCAPNRYYGYAYGAPGWYGYPYARAYYRPHWRHW